MRKLVYTVLLDPEPEEGGYAVLVPALPGCQTQGETLDEAIANAREAIAGHVESLRANGDPIPEEHEHPQLMPVTIHLPD